MLPRVNDSCGSLGTGFPLSPSQGVARRRAFAGVSELEFEASLDELERLVKTLGYRVVSRVTQTRGTLAPTAVLGEGKLLELAALTGGSGPQGWKWSG